MKNRGFYVLVKDDGEGGFIGIAPELKGCLSYGLTLDELMCNMEEVILLCLEDGEDAENPYFYGIQKVVVQQE
jgi:predicted RNase H-like HicB family nuclease